LFYLVNFMIFLPLPFLSPFSQFKKVPCINKVVKSSSHTSNSKRPFSMDANLVFSQYTHTPTHALSRFLRQHACCPFFPFYYKTPLLHVYRLLRIWQ